MKDIMSVVVFPANHLSKARYSIFVMKMPLNPNQSINLRVCRWSTTSGRKRKARRLGWRKSRSWSCCLPHLKSTSTTPSKLLSTKPNSRS